MSQIVNDLFPNTSTSPLGKKYLNQRQMITLAGWSGPPTSFRKDGE